jgi:peptidyl-prolyl cis-trans isomerase D
MTLVIAADLFRDSISNSYFVTEKEIKELTNILEQSVDIDFIKLDSNSLKKQIINSDDEIKDFYKNNEILFFSEEERSFKYILLESKNYEDSVDIPNGYIESAYDDYLAKNSQNQEIRFSHIMIEKLNYDSEEEAFNVIKEISDKLKNGENFYDLAMEFSDDVASKDNGGDLEYFDADIFPSEFAEAIEELSINEISEIVELDDTFHLLKITEFNKQKVSSLEDMRVKFINELVESESLALMNDDYDAIDEMIFANSSIEDIGKSISKDIIEESNKSYGNFNFIVDSSSVKEFIFSPDTEIGKPAIFNLDDSIIILSVNEVNQPELQNFEDVFSEANDYLSEKKTVEKKDLLVLEIENAKKEDTLDSFFKAYNFITKESYVGLKRGSSLLPQEIVSEVFELSSGKSITVNSRDGDTYFIDLIQINRPSSEYIDSVYDQYSSFAEQRISSNIVDIVNNDIFEAAKVNLNNLVF